MNQNKTGKYISQLEALKKAKKFFSRGYNQFDCPKKVEGLNYPKGLCKYFQELAQKGYLRISDKTQLILSACSAVDEIQLKSQKQFRYTYFPKNSDRLAYLNSEIKSLTNM